MDWPFHSYYNDPVLWIRPSYKILLAWFYIIVVSQMSFLTIHLIYLFLNFYFYLYVCVSYMWNLRKNYVNDLIYRIEVSADLEN